MSRPPPPPTRLLRLAVLGASPCGSCAARCCKQNGHAYAVLLEGDGERRRFAAFAVDVPIARRDAAAVIMEKALPYRAGRCVFLGGGDDLCTIYEDRPLNCRRFECVRGYHHGGGDLTGHSEFLRRNPDVLHLLDGM